MQANESGCLNNEYPGLVVLLRAPMTQIRGLMLALGKVDSAFLPFSEFIN